MKKLLLTLSFLSINLYTQAQCTITHTPGTNVNHGSGFLWGQSFTATCNGLLDSFEIYANQIGTMAATTLNMYSGNTVTGTPVYTQAISSIPVTVGSPIRIRLNTSLPVVTGQQYTWEFFCDVDVLADFGGTYAGGNAFQASQPANNADFTFTAFIGINSSVYYSDIDNEMSVYPNPATNLINISFLNKSVSGTVELINIEGQVVLSQNINSLITSIDLSTLAKGIYFVKVIAPNQLSMSKIVVE